MGKTNVFQNFRPNVTIDFTVSLLCGVSALIRMSTRIMDISLHKTDIVYTVASTPKRGSLEEVMQNTCMFKSYLGPAILDNIFDSHSIPDQF